MRCQPGTGPPDRGYGIAAMAVIALVSGYGTLPFNRWPLFDQPIAAEINPENAVFYYFYYSINSFLSIKEKININSPQFLAPVVPKNC